MTPEQIDTYCHRLAEAWKKMPEYLFLDMVNIGVAESGVFLVVVPNVNGTHAHIKALHRINGSNQLLIM